MISRIGGIFDGIDQKKHTYGSCPLQCFFAIFFGGGSECAGTEAGCQHGFV
jgi:hypothetical protein